MPYVELGWNNLISKDNDELLEEIIDFLSCR